MNIPIINIINTTTINNNPPISINSHQQLKSILQYLSDLRASHPNIKTDISKIFWLAVEVMLKKTISSNTLNNYTNYINNYEIISKDTKFLKKLFYKLTESPSQVTQDLKDICGLNDKAKTNELLGIKTLSKQIHDYYYYFTGAEYYTNASKELCELLLSQINPENLIQNNKTLDYINSSKNYIRKCIKFIEETKKNTDSEKNIVCLKRCIAILEFPIVTRLDINNIKTVLTNLYDNLFNCNKSFIEIQKTLINNALDIVGDNSIESITQINTLITGIMPRIAVAIAELNNIIKILNINE